MFILYCSILILNHTQYSMHYANILVNDPNFSSWDNAKLTAYSKERLSHACQAVSKTESKKYFTGLLFVHRRLSQIYIANFFNLLRIV